MNSRQRQPILAAVAVAIAFAGAVTVWRSSAFHTLAWMSPDSVSYLNSDVSRTPAYPLLIHVIPLGWLAAVQLLVLCASTAWLTWELATVLPAVFAVAFELIVLGNVQLMAYAFTVLPDAFFVSASQAQLALALRMFRSPGRANGILLGATTALLILLKPSGYSFVLALMIGGWWLWREARAEVLWALATMAGLILTVSAINSVRAGVFGTQAFGGYALIGYVGHLVEPDEAARFPELASTIAVRTATSRAELMAVRRLDEYYMLSSNAYHDVAGEAASAIMEHIRRDNPMLDDRGAAVRMNAIAQSIAVEAIAAHPAGYLRQFVSHLYGLWFLPLLRNRSNAREFAGELEEMTRTAPFTMRNGVAFRAVPAPVFWSIRLALIVALLSSCTGVVVALRRARSHLMASLAFCAVALHANFLLVAAVQPGLPRYALAMWPTAMATAGIGVFAAIQAVSIRSQAPSAMRRSDPTV